MTSRQRLIEEAIKNQRSYAEYIAQAIGVRFPKNNKLTPFEKRIILGMQSFKGKSKLAEQIGCRYKYLVSLWMKGYVVLASTANAVWINEEYRYLFDKFVLTHAGREVR